MRCATLLLLAASALAAEAPIILPAKNADPDGKVGERPYEMVWAKRKPAHAETLDFEDLGGWTTASFLGARAELFRSREEQMFGTYTGKVAYTGQTATSYLELRPPKPILIAGTPQAVQLWVRGNNWGWYPKPKTARTYIRVVVQDAKGEGFDIDLGQVNFDYWFLMHARFVSPTGNLARISPVRSTGDGKLDYPLSFVALRVSGCSDKRPAKLSFDSLQFYTPDDKPLAEPKLPPTDVPWPTTPDTITPTPKESVRVSRSQDGPVHIFTASGRRDRIRWSYLPKTGTLDDLTVEINGKRFRPCVGGGPVVELGGQQCRLSDPGVTARPVMLESRQDSLKAVFEVHKGDEAVQYAYEFRASGKSLQITVTEELAYHPSQVQVDRKRTIVTPIKGGKATAFRIGRTTGTPDADLFRVPYLTLGNGPHLVHWNGVFLSALLDWYNSDASTLDVQHGNPAPGEYIYNGGSRYLPKTDGMRNPLRERLIVTVATDVHEVLPHIPHPKSDTAHLARNAIWRNIGSPDEALLKRLKARGVENFICPLHEVGWRDAGESFTFRLRCAPRIGDAKMIEYGKWVKSLGYRFGLYANYTDFAPVNGNWREDRACLQPDGNWTGAWPRCYAPKPTYSWQAEAFYAPRIAAKFGANTCYSDVHTAVAPWGRTDYDARVPGAGMFRTTWACYAQTLWNESPSYHNGPVFSEGSYQWLYAGISDGNYGQMNGAGPPRWRRPPLVDFDLLKMHPLMTDFGMGAPNMFYGRHDGEWRKGGRTSKYLDRFITSTLAFGHIGYLALDWGFEGALKCYYMTNAVQQHYALVPVEAIRYFDGQKLVDTSTAIRTGAYKRGQVYVKYQSGLELWCNLSFEHDWAVKTPRGALVLPPAGHAAYAEEGGLFQYSAMHEGRRIDLVVGPQYYYRDTRGAFVLMDRFACRGAVATKPQALGVSWLIPAEDCRDITILSNHALSATAFGLGNEELGEAPMRVSNLGHTLMPVKGAVRYLVRCSPQPVPKPDGRIRRLVRSLEVDLAPTARAFAGKDLQLVSAEIERVGEDDKVQGKAAFVRLDQPMQVRIPADAKPDELIWYRLRLRGKADGKEVERVGWFTGLAARAIDVDVKPAIEEPQKPGSPQQLVLTMMSNLPEAADVALTAEATGLTLTPKASKLKLEPGKEHTLSLAYPLPAEPSLIPLTLTFTFPRGRQAARRWLRATEAQATVVEMAKLAPANTGLAFRGKPEQPLDTAATGGQFYPRRMNVGGVDKEGFFCHPPYKGGVGYAYGEFKVKLPEAPCAFECSVGFADGSTTEDGCVFSVPVKAGEQWQTIGSTQYAKLNAWQEFRADLSKFAGQELALRLVTDVGPKDNSSSDWACWGDPRIVYAGTYLLPQVLAKPVPLPFGPPPIPLEGLKAADLRNVAEAKLILDGAGANHGEYKSFVYLNGVAIGITPASASDTQWSEKQAVPIPAEALKTVGPRNTVIIKNPGQDCFKVRAVHLWFKLKDGRVGTSRVANGPFCSDKGWLHAEGQGVVLGSDLPAIPCEIPVGDE